MRRIAIYLTDTDQSDLRQHFPDYAVMLEELLSPHMVAEFQHFNVVEGNFPEDPTSFDGVVISGSAAFVGDRDPWIATLFDHIRQLDQAGTKLLGVCFGHQAIAAALGGRVERRRISLGATPMQLSAKRPWMQPEHDLLRLYAGNFEQIVALPVGLDPLGGHPDCLIAMIEKGTHILGLQFHPEFPTDYVIGYIEELRGHVPEEKIEAALSEVAGGHDGAIFGQWAARFLETQSVS